MSVIIFRNLNLFGETGLRKKRKIYISERSKIKHALGFQKKEGSLKWAEVVGEVSHMKQFWKQSFQAMVVDIYGHCREGRMPYLPLFSMWTWPGHISASANKENDLYALSISGISDLRILLGHYIISIMLKKRKRDKFSLKSQKISCLVLWKAGLNTNDHSLWSTWDGEFYIP